jgi:hypothetical protein
MSLVSVKVSTILIYNLTITDNVTGVCESKYNFNISTFIDHAIVQSMFMLSFIFVIVCDLFEWIQIASVLRKKNIDLSSVNYGTSTGLLQT